MANAQNKKPTKPFQDDLDAIFDEIKLESFPENLVDDGDDLDRLLRETTLAKPSAEIDANADKLLMVTEMERPGPKLVKFDAKSGKKHDIDALLDAIADDSVSEKNRAIINIDSNFDFNDFDVDDSNDDILASDLRSIVANRQPEPAKNAFDQLDDFDSFDEFGEINAPGAIKSKDTVFSAKPDITSSSKPKSMLELEEALGVEFKPEDDFSDDLAIGFAPANEDAAIAHEMPGKTIPEPESSAAVTAAQGSTTLEHEINELLDDDFVGLQESNDEFEPVAAETPPGFDLKPEVASKQVEPAKENAFDQLDDFETFDGFDESDELGGAKDSVFPSQANTPTLGESKSLIDLEENLDVAFKPTSESDIDLASMNKNTASSSVEIEKTVPQAESNTEAEAARLSATLEYELLEDDDFAELQESKAELEHLAAEEAPAAFDSESEEDFDFFKGSASDDFDLFSENDVDDEYAQDAEPVADQAYKFDNDTQPNDLTKIDGLGCGFSAPVAAATVVETVVDPALKEQISKLWDAHNQLADTIKQKEEAQQVDKEGQLDRQAKERRERKQLQDLLESKSKQTPRLVYVAVGGSVLSLLLGAGLWAFGIGAWLDIKDLKEHVGISDKNLAALTARLPTDTGGSVDKNATAALALSPISEKAAVIHGLHLPANNAKADLAQESKPSAASLEPSSAHTGQDTADKSIRVIATIDKNVTPPNAKPKKLTGQAPTAWVANLVSVRQDWYAKQKAAEFAKQGISAVVVPVNVKGETLYILRSTGFATQEQALQYASKAKKSLSLPSILVTKDE